MMGTGSLILAHKKWLLFFQLLHILNHLSMLMNNLFKTTIRPAGFLLLTSATSFSTYSACQSLPRMEAKSSTKNPLLDHSGLPRFDDISSLHVKDAIEENLQSLKKDFASLEASVNAGKAKDYSAIVEELERIQAPLSYSWGVVGHLMGVKNSDALREAHQSMQASVVKQNQELGQSVPVFRSLEKIKSNAEAWAALDEAQQRIVDASIMDMKKSGVGLSGHEKELFNQFKLELSELSTKFSNNLLDATKAYTLTLTDKKDVEGLPQSALSLLASKAVSEGHKEVSSCWCE